MYTFDGATSNGIGRLTNVVDSTGTSAIYYDIKGRVIQTDRVIDSVTYSTYATFDALDRIVTTTYPNGTVITKTYNGPQIETVAQGATTYVTYSGYDAVGKHGTATYGNGVTTIKGSSPSLTTTCKEKRLSLFPARGTSSLDYI